MGVSLKERILGALDQYAFIRGSLCALVLIISVFSLCLSANGPQEYDVETAFIYQFTNYIQWPSESLKAPTDPFVISVVGRTPIVDALQKLASAKTIKERKIEILVTQDGKNLKKSHIVIITSTDEHTLKEVLKKAKGNNSLVISYADGFAKKGAMINFFLEEGRLRFEINRTAFELEKLQLGSQLLMLGRIVQ